MNFLVKLLLLTTTYPHRMSNFLPRDSTILKKARAASGKSDVSTAQVLHRHKYFLTDEMAVFQVEDHLFRVPQYLLGINSPFFRSMFSLPRGDGEEVEGRSETNPVCLPGVTVVEFETLLQYLFEGMHDDFRLPQPGWIALLSIAHRYEFLNVYKRAVREIYDFKPSLEPPDSKLDYVMLISVAEKYDVPLQHMVPTFTALVLRENPLEDAEAAHLSILTLCRLARAREHYLRRYTLRPSRLSDRLDGAERIVREIWLLNTT